MKKTLVALATMAATGAFAQVTLYGMADMYVGKASTTANGVTTSVGNVLGMGGLSNSRIGFKAVEDLGGGMSATVVYETNVASDAPAASTLGDRVSTLALASGAHGLTMGRQYTPGLNYIACNNAIGCPNNDSTGYGVNTTTRASNAISYGYNAGALSAQAMMSFNENGTGDGSNATQYNGLGGSYTAGPLVVSGAYETNATVTAGSATSVLTGVAATYDLGAAKVSAQLGNLRNAGNVDAINKNGFGLAALIPMGSSAFWLSYGSNVSSGAASNSTTTAYTLAYSYSLSKTTVVYASWQNVSQDSNAALYAGGTASATTTTYAFGARKSF